MNKRRQRFLFVHTDFSRGYPALNSTRTLFLRTWLHFHNFYFQCLCLGSHWPRARPLGSLIIRTLRPECEISVFWLRGCKDLHMGGNMGSFKVFFFSSTWRCWCNPFCLFRRVKPEVTALKTGSVLDKNLHHVSHDMHTVLYVWMRMSISWWKE